MCGEFSFLKCCVVNHGMPKVCHTSTEAPVNSDRSFSAPRLGTKSCHKQLHAMWRSSLLLLLEEDSAEEHCLHNMRS